MACISATPICSAFLCEYNFMIAIILVWTTTYNINGNRYVRTSNPFVTSPDVADAKLYSCSLAINFRIQPVIPSNTGSFVAKPVMLPVPPRKTGSRKVILEKSPCNQKKEKRNFCLCFQHFWSAESIRNFKFQFYFFAFNQWSWTKLILEPNLGEVILNSKIFNLNFSKDFKRGRVWRQKLSIILTVLIYKI